MNRLPLGLRILGYGSANLVLAFLVLPLLAVIPASFNQASFIRLPPNAYSGRWYGAFLEDREWMTTLATSGQVAVAAMVLALVVGVPAALGLHGLGRRARTLLSGLFLAPMIVPVIVTAVALYRSAIDMEISGTLLAMALGHALLALPLVVINVGISLRSLDPAWLRAAAGLGATPFKIFRSITLPNILPGVVGGGVFAFLTSFDEVVVSVFLAGYQSKTLPVKMWEAIRLEFTPVVAVAAVFMILLAAALFLLAKLASGRRKESRA